MSEHCEHCDSDCKEGKVPWNDIGPYEHYDYDRAWNRPCPVCTERDRIVAHIRCCSCAPCRRLADSIERGEHLEEK